MRKRLLAGAMVLGFCLSLPVVAATHMTMTSHVEPPAGSGATAEESTYTVWLTENRLREDKGQRSVIVDRDTGKLYVIKHRERIYHVLDLPIDAKKLIPPEVADWYANTAQQMKMEVVVSRTDETRELAGYATRKHVAHVSNKQGMTMTMDMWTTLDSSIDSEAYKSLMLELANLQPAGSEWIRKLFEIEGFPVLVERTVATPGGEHRARDELTRLEQKDAPAGTFSPPDGYTLTEFDFMKEAPGF